MASTSGSVRTCGDPSPVRHRRRRFIFRTLGVVALLLLVGASVTDVALTHFWDRNAMVTGIIADVLVLLVGVAVVNEWLDIRASERWRTVAYYALVELVYASRDAWVRLCNQLNIHEGEHATILELRNRVLEPGGFEILEVRAAQALADPVARRELFELVVELSDETREALTNWAPVMITTAPSADAINRFTRLHGRLMRLRFVLQEDIEGHRIPNIEVGDDAWAARRVAMIVRVGAELSEAYRSDAYKLVPPEEWSDDPSAFGVA
jgi:hypothetical protein